VLVDVLFEVNQLQRHTFELPAGYYPSPKSILKAIEGKKHRTPLRKKFDIGMNEIDHKIGIAVKKDCQCRPQSTVLRFDRQVVNADYDNRVQYEYLTQKYDLRTWSLLSTSHPRRYTVRVTRCHLQD
jgi:hypothetical protein